MFVPTTLEQLNTPNDESLKASKKTIVFVDHPPATAPSITTTTTVPVKKKISTTTTLMESTLPAVSISEPGNVWDTLADCESGQRRRDKSVIPGTANWSYQGQYEGGLQFAPSTWSDYVASGRSYALVGYPDHAYQATRDQQIVVAIRVRDGVDGSSGPYLNAQGWNAWPTCRHYAGV